MNRRKPGNDGADKLPTDDNLNFRVQDKGSSDPDAGARKSRIGNMLKDAKGLKEGAAETLKRPLTGLFRRPGSKAGRRKEEVEDSGPTQAPVVRETTKIISALEDVILNDESPRTASRGDHTNDNNPMRNSQVDGITRAPKLSTTNLHSIMGENGLDSKLAYLYKVDDIDVSILCRHILRENEVEDEDVPWTWDHLYASLSSELRQEWAADEIPMTGR